MSLLVVGSVALDSIETPFGKKNRILGGSATHFSFASSFFTKPKLVAVVGQDFPNSAIKSLKSRGVDLKGLQVEKGKTFHWKGKYESDMNTAHTIYTHLNVFENFSPRIPQEYKNTKNLFLANIDPDLQQFVLNKLGSPRLVASDSMNYWIETKKKSLLKLLKKVDIFMVNDAEARMLSGCSNLIKAAKFIVNRGPKAVIIKKGEHGVMYFAEDNIFSVPGYPLETIHDPTGAGDSFAGGFMGYLSRLNKISVSGIKKAIVYGSVIASYNVEDFGPNRLLRLKTQDIKKRYKAFRNLVKF